MADNRIGFAFNNPDLTSDYYYPGWGKIVTPDELRYVVLFGTRLTSSDQSQTYTDDMLQYYIDNAIALVERDLNIDIYPRTVRYEDPIDQSTGQRIPRTDILNDPNLVREPGYPYRTHLAEHYMYVRLRRRPLQEVLAAKIVDPMFFTTIDIYSWRREFPGFESMVQFFPNKFIAALGQFPYVFTRQVAVRYPYDNYPNAIMIDYRTGFKNAKDVPRELVEVVRLLSGIALLNDFGDGRTAALASQSTNLNSISESFTTTMSATNAMYGARIIQFQKQLKEWWQRNHRKYKRNYVGTLGA